MGEDASGVPPAHELFVVGLWQWTVGIVKDPAWIDRVAAPSRTDEYSAIVRRMLDAGVARSDIARFAHINAYDAVHGALYFIDDPYASDERLRQDLRNLAFGLFRVDPDTDEPLELMRSLFEDFGWIDSIETAMLPTGGQIADPEG